MTTTSTQPRTAVTPENRDQLAALVNGRPVPPADSRLIGPQFEREEAFRRADNIIGMGWAPANAPHPGRNVREQIAQIISGSPTPSKRSYTRADEILATIEGRA